MYRITGLAPELFKPLFGLPDADLAARGVTRYVADVKPGFPCRISLRDAEPGEGVLLLNYTHQAADTPYRASHAIFVREAATEAYAGADQIPEVLRGRPLSVRAFDPQHMMVDADLVEGREAQGLIARFFADPTVAYLHVHYAKRGCYAARIDRT